MPWTIHLFFLCGSASYFNLHSFPTRRSSDLIGQIEMQPVPSVLIEMERLVMHKRLGCAVRGEAEGPHRSEEHTSELQSRLHLVCRLLLEKKKNNLMCSQMIADPAPPL